MFSCHLHSIVFVRPLFTTLFTPHFLSKNPIRFPFELRPYYHKIKVVRSPNRSFRGFRTHTIWTSKHRVIWMAKIAFFLNSSCRLSIAAQRSSLSLWWFAYALRWNCANESGVNASHKAKQSMGGLRSSTTHTSLELSALFNFVRLI